MSGTGSSTGGCECVTVRGRCAGVVDQIFPLILSGCFGELNVKVELLDEG